MANPGKTYELPCKLYYQYADAGDKIMVFIEKIRLGRRDFQINAYPISIETDDSYEQFLFEQECGGGDY